MKKLLSLSALGLLLSMNAMADCGVHILNLDRILTGEKTRVIELKKLALKNNYKLKIDSKEVISSDIIIQDFIVIDSLGQTQFPTADWITHRMWPNDYFKVYTGLDYSKTLLVSELKNGELNDIDTMEFKYKVKYSKIERKYDSNLFNSHTRFKVDMDATEALISQLPKCRN